MLEDKFCVLGLTQENFKKTLFQNLLKITTSETAAYTTQRVTERILCLNHQIKRGENIDTGNMQIWLNSIKSDFVFLLLFSQEPPSCLKEYGGFKTQAIMFTWAA